MSSDCLLFSASSCQTRWAIRALAGHRPLHHYQGGAFASVEGVLASALSGWPAAGASGAGGRFWSGLHGAAVPDAEALEPALHVEPGRCLLCLALHGFIWLCSAAAGEPGEAAVETWTEARLHRPWGNAGHLRLHLGTEIPLCHTTGSICASALDARN